MIVRLVGRILMKVEIFDLEVYVVRKFVMLSLFFESCNVEVVFFSRLLLGVFGG